MNEKHQKQYTKYEELKSMIIKYSQINRKVNRENNPTMYRSYILERKKIAKELSKLVEHKLTLVDEW